MQLIYNSIFSEHDTGMHPENKKRLTPFKNLPETKIENGEKYLTLIHTPEYIERVRYKCKDGGGNLDPDTIVSQNSYIAAIHAVGATITASNKNDFALTRPPGHHAHINHSSGFCLFNNIAIAAKYHANQGKRVLIFDFDGHLGDGTVKYFYNSNQVMYWSIHQYPAFPGGGGADEIGIGDGRGYTINVPLPPESGDEIFMDAFNTFLPVAREFNPDIVALSAGFDAHQYDLLLDLRLSANSYYKIGKILRENFSNMFATLEGGYNVEIFPKCLHNFLNGINNEKMSFIEKETDSRILTYNEYELRASRAVKYLSKYWSSI